MVKPAKRSKKKKKDKKRKVDQRFIEPLTSG